VVADESTGVVMGNVGAVDPDVDVLVYSVGTLTTTKGTVSVSADGSFVYVPTAGARHAAAEVGGPVSAGSDSFVVEVSDGYGGVAQIAVQVAVSPLNTAPSGVGATVGAANATTGLSVVR